VSLQRNQNLITAYPNRSIGYYNDSAGILFASFFITKTDLGNIRLDGHILDIPNKKEFIDDLSSFLTTRDSDHDIQRIAKCLRDNYNWAGRERWKSKLYGCICKEYLCVIIPTKKQLCGHYLSPHEHEYLNPKIYIYHLWDFEFISKHEDELTETIQSQSNQKINLKTDQFIYCSVILQMIVVKCKISKVTFEELSADNLQFGIDTTEYFYEATPSVVINSISLCFIMISLIVVASSKNLRRNMHGALLICLLITMIINHLHTYFFVIIYGLIYVSGMGELDSYITGMNGIVFTRSYLTVENAIHLWIITICYDIYDTLRYFSV
jgi:hypothetical protein